MAHYLLRNWSERERRKESEVIQLLEVLFVNEALAATPIGSSLRVVVPPFPNPPEGLEMHETNSHISVVAPKCEISSRSLHRYCGENSVDNVRIRQHLLQQYASSPSPFSKQNYLTWIKRLKSLNALSDKCTSNAPFSGHWCGISKHITHCFFIISLKTYITLRLPHLRSHSHFHSHFHLLLQFIWRSSFSSPSP